MNDIVMSKKPNLHTNSLNSSITKIAKFLFKLGTTFL
jgi:hypothetical protein